MGGNFLEWQKLRKIKPSKIKSFLLQKPYKPILPLDKLIHGAYTYPGTGKCKPLQYNTVVFPETVSIKTTYALKLFNCFKSMKNLSFFLFYHCWWFSGFEQKISVTEEENGAWKTQISKYNQQAHGKFGKKKIFLWTPGEHIDFKVVLSAPLTHVKSMSQQELGHRELLQKWILLQLCKVFAG